MAKYQDGLIPYEKPYERPRYPGEIYRDEGEETYRKNRRKGKVLEEFKKEAKAAMTELFKKDNEGVDLGSDKVDANEAFKSQEVGKNPASVAVPVKPVTENTDQETYERELVEENEAREKTEKADKTKSVKREEKLRSETQTESQVGKVEQPPFLPSQEKVAENDKSKRSDHDNDVSGPPFPV